jgi:hypothetical protein
MAVVKVGTERPAVFTLVFRFNQIVPAVILGLVATIQPSTST